MADKKISELGAVTDVVSGDEYVLARSGASKKIDADDLAAGIAALYPPGGNASDVAIADAGTYYTATDVEGALQEIGAGGIGGGGGMAVVYDSTLGSAAANFDVTGISGSYAGLSFALSGRGTTAATEIEARLRMNNDSGNNYEWQRFFIHSGTSTGGAAGSATSSVLLGELSASTATAARAGAVRGEIHDYAGTTFDKMVLCEGGRVASIHLVDIIAGSWLSTSAITRLTFFPSSGNFDTGTRLTIWGLGA